MELNLKDIMYKNNQTISTLSEETGMSRTTITSLYKNNAKGIQFDTLKTLCDTLNCTPNDLFGYKSDDSDLKSTNNMISMTIKQSDTVLLEVAINMLRNICLNKSIKIYVDDNIQG